MRLISALQSHQSTAPTAGRTKTNLINTFRGREEASRTSLPASERLQQTSFNGRGGKNNYPPIKYMTWRAGASPEPRDDLTPIVVVVVAVGRAAGGGEQHQQIQRNATVYLLIYRAIKKTVFWLFLHRLVNFFFVGWFFCAGVPSCKVNSFFW